MNNLEQQLTKAGDMKLLRFCLILSFCTCFNCYSEAQTRTIEKLKNHISETQTNDQRLQAVLSLCEQGYNLHADTLMAYAKKAEAIARELNDLDKEIKARYFQSYALTTKGLIDSSLHIADECLELLQRKLHDPVLQGNLYNQKGRCYMRKNMYKEAIDMGYKTINEGEKSQDILLQMQGKTLIGWANLEMDRTRESLKWHIAALHTTGDQETLGKYSILFANLALNYSALGKMDSAFLFIDKAVNFSRRHENLFALSNSLAIQAQLFARSGQSKKAEAPLEEVVEIRKLIGDPFYIVSDMAQLGIYYANNGQYEKGIKIARDGITIARQYHIDTKLFFLYSTLAENYKAKGDNVLYARTLEKIIELKDSVYLENSEKALAEMQARYDHQRNENMIIRQQFEIAQKNYFIYGSVLLSVLILIAAVLLFRNYRKRQRMKMEMMLEQEQRKAAGAIKEAEENERKRIAADLHDNLGAYAASLASNIDIIQLQNADNGNNDLYRDLKLNSQSIISQLNDTIWVLKKESLSLTAISDKIKVFIRHIQPGYPGVSIDVDESIDNDYQLPPSQAFHLYRVVQEAINNALKHSKGTKVLVKITANAGWTITITDNGKGMISRQTDKHSRGDGIANMVNRCKEAGWEIEWISAEEGGTMVMISPTTN